MSLEKGIEHGKEHRKPYRGAGRFDRTCRNHGSCPYCEGRRTFFDKKWRETADQQIREIEFEESQQGESQDMNSL